ncbi:MAG: MarR family transcriptional regulator [Pseudonocardia sp.]|nr:MarR family transcriptional regulator [Pseudonocardia sp.]
MTAGPEADFTLDEQLCFALYSASRAMTGAYRDRLATVGLSYTQYVVLLLLWEHHSLPMSQLGKRLHLDSATLSPVLQRMAAAQLITRTRSNHDERTVQITCTDSGHALRERVRAVQSEVRAGTGLSEADLVVMREDLHRVANRLRDGTSSGWSAESAAPDVEQSQVEQPGPAA